MNLPDQPPALWAPRFRVHLNRALTWADRRKAQRLARDWLERADLAWRDEYAAWWWDNGWHQGADPPDTAYAKVRAHRQRGTP